MMSKNQNKIQYITKSFILYFMIIKFILCELNECERDKPIKKGLNAYLHIVQIHNLIQDNVLFQIQ